MNTRVRRKRSQPRSPGGVKRESRKGQDVRARRKFKSVYASASLDVPLPGTDGLSLHEVVSDQGFEWTSSDPTDWDAGEAEVLEDPGDFLKYSLYAIERSRFYSPAARAEVVEWAEAHGIDVEGSLPQPVEWEPEEVDHRDRDVRWNDGARVEMALYKCARGHVDRVFTGGVWRCRTCHNDYSRRHNEAHRAEVRARGRRRMREVRKKAREEATA